MSNPRQPEQRRSGKGGATPRRAPGTDKGRKGGEGGGVPPEQRPEHP